MNRLHLLLLLASLLPTACGGRAAWRTAASEAPAEPTRYTYRIKAVYPHSTTAYTQGLCYADGLLWEGTGEYGRSELRTTDLETGRTQTLARLPESEFGEGIALVDTLVYQLTWESNTCHVYDRRTGEELRRFRYAGEGWGLASDPEGRKLWFTNGSANLYELDLVTFRRTATRTVTLAGEPVRFLNELEWIDGRIWANVYLTDRVAIIDPHTGEVTGEVDFGGLQTPADRTPDTDVFNGIAYDAATGDIYVTGKNWNKVYKVEIFEKEEE